MLFVAPKFAVFICLIGLSAALGWSFVSWLRGGSISPLLVTVALIVVFMAVANSSVFSGGP